MSSESKCPQEKSYCCHICKARYNSKEMCKQHIMSHMTKITNSDIQSEFNTIQNGNIYAQKAIEEVNIEKIVDEIKEEVTVKDEPIENSEDQNYVNLLSTDHLHHSNMKYKNMPYGNYKLQEMQTGEKHCHQLSIKQELNNIEKEQKYKCSNCDKAFSEKENLDSHMILHTGERLYQCDWCDKAFTKKLFLRRHCRIHTEEKAYQCSYCDIAFSIGTNLKRHMRTHIRDNPYQCCYCNMPFKQKINLCRHMRKHTEEKPSQYSHGDQTFSSALHFFLKYTPNEELSVGVLPTKHNVLECMMYLLLPMNNECRMSVKEASDVLARKLIRHWGFANIYTKEWKYVSKEIEKLYYDACNNLNNSVRNNNNKISEHWKKAFNTEMGSLFDIFCEDEGSRNYKEESALVKMRKEDYDFLYDMRGERKMYCDNFFCQTWKTKTYYEQKLKEGNVLYGLCEQQNVKNDKEREVDPLDIAKLVDRSRVAKFWKKTKKAGKSGNFEKSKDLI